MNRYKKAFNKATAVFTVAVITLTACSGGIFVKASDNISYSESVFHNVDYDGKKYVFAVERTYDTANPDEHISFENTYNAKKIVDVNYEIIASVPETEIKEETQNKTYKNLENNNKADLPQSITVDDVECILDKAEFVKQDTEEHVTYRQQLGYSIDEPSEYPKTYDYTYTSPVTDKEVTVTLPFSHLEKGEEGWIDGFTARVTLQNIDGEYFDFGGSTYTYSDSDNPSFSEAEYTYLVKQLGYSTKEYRLTSAVWSGKPYEKNGVTCRDAICTGQQYGAMYEAVYEDDVINKELYTAMVTYTGSKEIESGNNIYKVKATGYYGEKKVNIVSVSIAVLLLIVLIVAILYYISSGRKKKISVSEKN